MIRPTREELERVLAEVAAVAGHGGKGRAGHWADVLAAEVRALREEWDEAHANYRDDLDRLEAENAKLREQLAAEQKAHALTKSLGDGFSVAMMTAEAENAKFRAELDRADTLIAKYTADNERLRAELAKVKP